MFFVKDENSNFIAYDFVIGEILPEFKVDVCDYWARHVLKTEKDAIKADGEEEKKEVVLDENGEEKKNEEDEGEWVSETDTGDDEEENPDKNLS